MSLYSKAKACLECQRRKRKCIPSSSPSPLAPVPLSSSLLIPSPPPSPSPPSPYSTTPQACLRCISKNLICSFTSSRSPSGDIYPLQPLNTITTTMMANIELVKYFDVAWHFTPLSWMGLELVKQSDVPSHQFITSAAAALSARAWGNEKHSEALFYDASIKFAAMLQSDCTAESLVGCLLMSFYTLGTARMKPFIDRAVKIFDKLSLYEHAPQAQICFLRSCELVSSTADEASKIKKFFSGSRNVIAAQNNDEKFYVAAIRLMMKVFGSAPDTNMDHYRVDAMAVLFCHITFTEEQRNDIFQEIETVNQIKVDNPLKVYIQSFNIEFLTMFVNWRSGYLDLAREQALKLTTNFSTELLLFGTKSECVALLTTSILLYTLRQYEPAQRLYKMATTLYTFLIPSRSPLKDSIPMFTSFFLAKQDPSSCISSDHIQSIISNIISLVSMFLPNNDDKNLVSPHGLFVWYNSFSTLNPSPHSSYSRYLISSESSSSNDSSSDPLVHANSYTLAYSTTFSSTADLPPIDSFTIDSSSSPLSYASHPSTSSVHTVPLHFPTSFNLFLSNPLEPSPLLCINNI